MGSGDQFTSSEVATLCLVGGVGYFIQVTKEEMSDLQRLQFIRCPQIIIVKISQMIYLYFEKNTATQQESDSFDASTSIASQNKLLSMFN